MAHDWILDVLADLREFAGRNGLGVTEKQIDQVLVTVSDELASTHEIAPQNAARSIGHVREFSGTIAEGRNS